MGVELGRRIADALRKSSMNQKDLAARICVTEQAMSRYISGTRDPKPEVIANIATALHTTSDYLLGIENTDFDYPNTCKLIARNSRKLTPEEKKELISAIMGVQ